MFVGHYGVSFATKSIDRRIPLWVLFIAVQFLDVLWAPFVLLGVEKTRIVPGITASNPFDLYYMPYSHSLLAAVGWSIVVLAAYPLWTGSNAARGSALLVALAVFSHWLLDLIVHRPDLPLYDDTAKVGLGLWNWAAVSFALEGLLLLGGMTAYLRPLRRGRVILGLFGAALLGIQADTFFGPPPSSDRAFAIEALALYTVFAWFVAWWERRYATLSHVPGVTE